MIALSIKSKIGETPSHPLLLFLCFFSKAVTFSISLAARLFLEQDDVNPAVTRASSKFNPIISVSANKSSSFSASSAAADA